MNNQHEKENKIKSSLFKPPFAINITYCIMYIAMVMTDAFIIDKMNTDNTSFLVSPAIGILFTTLLIMPFLYLKERKQYVKDGKATAKHMYLMFVIFLILSILFTCIPLIALVIK